jgi:dihydrodipicolinate synthase/N-acetylneuraminate lyase
VIGELSQFLMLSPKEKEKAVSIAVGTVKGTVQGMGAATKGGKYHWVGPKDSKW